MFSASFYKIKIRHTCLYCKNQLSIGLYKTDKQKAYAMWPLAKRVQNRLVYCSQFYGKYQLLSSKINTLTFSKWLLACLQPNTHNFAHLVNICAFYNIISHPSLLRLLSSKGRHRMQILRLLVGGFETMWSTL